MKDQVNKEISISTGSYLHIKNNNVCWYDSQANMKTDGQPRARSVRVFLISGAKRTELPLKTDNFLGLKPYIKSPALNRNTNEHQTSSTATHRRPQLYRPHAWSKPFNEVLNTQPHNQLIERVNLKPSINLWPLHKPYITQAILHLSLIHISEPTRPY